MRTPSDKFVVRLPKGLRDQVAESAGYYRRSMNSDIVARLQASLNGIPDDGFEKAVEPVLHREVELMFRSALSEEEQDLVRTYRRLSVKKRCALRELLL